MPEGFFTQPLYLQLRDALAERIARGEWKPGTVLPAEGNLARELGVSTGTVRKALDLLESEHLLSRRQGRGTFVIDTGSQGAAHGSTTSAWQMVQPPEPRRQHSTSS